MKWIKKVNKYKSELQSELKRQKFFEKYGKIPNDIKRFKKYLKSLHHHEILPNRLYLIGRIQKALSDQEKRLYKERYKVLQEMNPNHSWDQFVETL